MLALFLRHDILLQGLLTPCIIFTVQVQLVMELPLIQQRCDAERMHQKHHSVDSFRVQRLLSTLALVIAVPEQFDSAAI
jgi:hypothetical protein